MDLEKPSSKQPSAQSELTKKVVVLTLVGKGGGKSKTYKFDKERIVLGSVVSADVRLVGEGVSPIHAVLEVHRNTQTNEVEATLFDLASDTGVFVDDKKVITQVLTGQHKITIGKHQLAFRCQEVDITGKIERVRKTAERTLFLNPDEDLSPLILEDEAGIEEIFDYRSGQKRALEVVMSWSQMILEVEHFVHERQITVGSELKSDFAIPPLLSSGKFPVAVQRGNEFVLNIDRQMKGVVQKAGHLVSLDGSQKEIALGQNDFAKISIGEIHFYFSFTAAPPRLKRRRMMEKDPFFTKVFSVSVVLSMTLLFGLTRLQLDQTIEPEKIPDRIATILYEPEKFMKPVETPKTVPAPKQTIRMDDMKKPEEKKPLPKTMEVSKQQPKPAGKAASAPEPMAKQGEGARAQGKEGTRGEKDGKPSTQKMTQASGDGQVADVGNVDLLKGAGGKIQNILGNSAAQLGNTDNLRGFGTFTSRGTGGLALSGSGQGGGGTAENTLGGLGNKGTGLGRVGTGKGAAGTGTGLVGSHVRVGIRTDGPEEAVVMGGIDRNAIAEAIYAHKDEFRLCYEREINAENPNLAGQVNTSFVIGASGRVTQGGIESSTLKNPNAERCIIAVLKRIEFPMPKGGGIVEVHFPFKFNAVGR